VSISRRSFFRFAIAAGGSFGFVRHRVEEFFVRDFGAVGDGRTDDTDAISDAIRAAGVRGGAVRFAGGKTYIVSRSGTQARNGVIWPFCLAIPNRVTLDLAGATIRQAAGQNACVIVNAPWDGMRSRDIAVVNGTIDVNGTNQKFRDGIEQAALGFSAIDRLRISGISVRDAVQYAGRFLACDDADFLNLLCLRSLGDGWSFGIASAGQELLNSRVDFIRAFDCAGRVNRPLQQGNGIILTAKRSQVGTLIQINCGGGIKVQDTSEEVEIGSVYVEGGRYGTENSGFKIQGGSAGTPNRIRAEIVSASENEGSGLFLHGCRDVSITSYLGLRNAKLGAHAHDVVIGGESSTVAIHRLASRACKGASVVAVFDNAHFALGEVVIHDPAAVGVLVFDGTGDIGALEASDGLRPPNMREAFKVTGGGAGRVGQIRFGLEYSPGRRPLSIAPAAAGWTIGPVTMGDDSPAHGSTLLRPGVTTPVKSSAAWHYRVGSEKFLRPVFRLVAGNSAMRLLGVENVRCEAERGELRSGFTLHHPPASGAELIEWRIEGYQVAESVRD